MERLTTDNPTGCSDTMLNLAYAQDRLVHIRNMGTPFLQYIRQQCQAHECDMPEISDNELCEIVFECGFDKPDCPVFLLYTIATQAAELRARLKGYEDAEEQGLLVRLPCKAGNTPTIDAVPAMHGKWFFTECEYFTCSVCGDSYRNDAETTAQANSYLASGNTHNFCPGCGAKMDKE